MTVPTYKPRQTVRSIATATGVNIGGPFVLTNHNGELFFVVGDRSNVEMIGLQQVAAATQDEEPSSDAGADLMDFDMI